MAGDTGEVLALTQWTLNIYAEYERPPCIVIFDRNSSDFPVWY